MGYSSTQSFEVFDEDGDGCWEITAEVDFRLVGGCAPWKGSIYSCPSDVDWYGDAGDIEIEAIRIIAVVDLDDDGNAADVDLDSWEHEIVERYVLDNLDDDELYEAADEQAEDDFDPPEPDFGPDYEYDY